MGQQVLNKDSNEVKRFIEAMEGISKMLDANIVRTFAPFVAGMKVYPKCWMQIL